MLVLVYHPTLFASIFTSLINLIISFWYAWLAFERGAAAARFCIESSRASAVDASIVGKGKVLVISRVPLTSIPTREPVAMVGYVCEECLIIFITT